MGRSFERKEETLSHDGAEVVKATTTTRKTRKTTTQLARTTAVTTQSLLTWRSITARAEATEVEGANGEEKARELLSAHSQNRNEENKENGDDTSSS